MGFSRAKYTCKLGVLATSTRNRSLMSHAPRITSRRAGGKSLAPMGPKFREEMGAPQRKQHTWQCVKLRVNGETASSFLTSKDVFAVEVSVVNCVDGNKLHPVQCPRTLRRLLSHFHQEFERILTRKTRTQNRCLLGAAILSGRTRRLAGRECQPHTFIILANRHHRTPQADFCAANPPPLLKILR